MARPNHPGLTGGRPDYTDKPPFDRSLPEQLLQRRPGFLTASDTHLNYGDASRATDPLQRQRGGALSPAPPSSSSGLTYADVTYRAGEHDDDEGFNLFALAGSAQDEAVARSLAAPVPPQRGEPHPSLTAPAPTPAPAGLPPSAFSLPHPSSALPPTPPRPSAPPHSATLAPASRALLSALRSDAASTPPRARARVRSRTASRSASWSWSSAADEPARAGLAGAGRETEKENVPPQRRRDPAPAHAQEHAPPLTPRRQRRRVAEWREEVRRAASASAEAPAEGDGGEGWAGGEVQGDRARGEEMGRKAAGGMGVQREGKQAQGGKKAPAAGPAQAASPRKKKTRARSKPAAAAAVPSSSPPPRRSTRGQPREPRSGSESGAAAPDETGVSTRDLVAMLPRRAKRFVTRARRGEGVVEEGEETDYDEPVSSPPQRPLKRKPPAAAAAAAAGRKPRAAQSRKRRRRDDDDDDNDESDDSATRRRKDEARRKWAEVDAFELEVVRTL